MFRIDFHLVILDLEFLRADGVESYGASISFIIPTARCSGVGQLSPLGMLQHSNPGARRRGFLGWFQSMSWCWIYIHPGIVWNTKKHLRKCTFTCQIIFPLFCILQDGFIRSYVAFKGWSWWFFDVFLPVLPFSNLGRGEVTARRMWPSWHLASCEMPGP